MQLITTASSHSQNPYLYIRDTYANGRQLSKMMEFGRMDQRLSEDQSSTTDHHRLLLAKFTKLLLKGGVSAVVSRMWTKFAQEYITQMFVSSVIKILEVQIIIFK